MKLLKIEWLKLKKYKTFYILSGLFLLVFLLINICIDRGYLDIKAGQNASISLFSADYSFAAVWQNLSYYYGWSLIFFCVLVIISMSNEFRYKTQRQHIIDGLSRTDFLHAKVLFVVVLSIILTLFFTLTGLIFGYANGGGNPFEHAQPILYVFIYSLNFLSFSALLALLIKRSGLSIMLLMVYVFFENIISSVADKLFNIQLGRYLPLESSDGLFPFPFGKLFKAMLAPPAQDSNYAIMLSMSCVFILVYYGIARWRMTAADL